MLVSQKTKAGAIRGIIIMKNLVTDTVIEDIGRIKVTGVVYMSELGDETIQPIIHRRCPWKT